MTPQEKAYSIQEVINLIDDRQYDNDPRAEEAKKTLETIRQALQSQAEKDDNISNARRFCKAVIEGYPNQDINHEEFRVQVTKWAEDLLKDLGEEE